MKITEDMKNGTGIEGDIKLTKENLLKTISEAKKDGYKYIGIVTTNMCPESGRVFDSKLNIYKNEEFDYLYEDVVDQFHSCNLSREVIYKSLQYEQDTYLDEKIIKFWAADTIARICEVLEY